MPPLNPLQIQRVLLYLRVWVQAFHDTVELAAFAAEDVLSGKETEFSILDKNFLEALDQGIYHISHSAQAAMRLLVKHPVVLTQRQYQALKFQRRKFRHTSRRLGALFDALEHIYVFRKPPH